MLKVTLKIPLPSFAQDVNIESDLVSEEGSKACGKGRNRMRSRSCTEALRRAWP